MSGPGRHSEEVVFELTVAGEVGPALRCALQPRVAERRPGSVIRAVASGRADVADIVGVLTAEGLTIESIRVCGSSTERRVHPRRSA